MIEADNRARSLVTGLFYIGLLVQGLGYVTYFKSIFNDPFYGFLAVVLGYFITLILCIEMLLRRDKPQSNTLMPDEGMTMMKRNALYGNKQRLAALGTLLLATSLFIFVSRGILFVNSGTAEAPPINSIIQEYQERKSVFSLVTITHTNWVGGGAFAIVGREKDSSERKRYPFAAIIHPDDARVDTFWGTACALTFDLEARESADYVRIDDMTVTVKSYQPLPEYESILPSPFKEANLYYIEMDDPRVSRTDTFRAKHYYEKGQRKEIGPVRAEKGKPETFVIRINAKTPGIYDFSCELLLSHGNTKEKVVLVRSQEFLFDGKRKAAK